MTADGPRRLLLLLGVVLAGAIAPGPLWAAEPLAPRFRLAVDRASENPPPEPLPVEADATSSERIVNRAKSHLNRSVARVSVPALYFHRPAEKSAVATAIVVCPGGGYSHLAIDKAGHDIARWLNSHGITAVVLKYRLKQFGHPAPLDDVRKAIATVRQRAGELGVRPDCIGVMGFSAGGHLAGCAGVHPAEVAMPNGETVSSRPDFQVLVFPLISMDSRIVHRGAQRNLLGRQPTPRLLDFYSLEKQVSGDAPPTFLVHCLDDKLVPIEHSLRMYRALQSNNVPVEFAMYERGGHGFGLVSRRGPVAEWPRRCHKWLAKRHLMEAEQARDK